MGREENFFDLGGHSLLLLQVHEKLQSLFPASKLSVVELFKYPTVRALSERLGPGSQALERARPQERKEQHRGEREPIAIVGMAGRFPKARSVAEYWENLRAGRECVTFFTDEELRGSGVSEELLRDPAYVKARAILEDVDLFDAPFFSYTPREAEVMDPQQRLFLETAWEALEDAGYDAERCPGPVGVYAGANISTYLHNNLHRSPEVLAAAGGLQTKVGNDKDSLATRVSYQLGLRGPSVSVQTACSTSLVAVHMACASLLSGECDMALAGGVSIGFPQKVGYLYQEEGILAPDGHCRAFDEDARGTVSGSGVGVVVLKRLSDALAAGDTIRGVILGSAVNNDGSLKVGYTAPSVQGQAEVVAAALANAGVAPGTIGYLEAHGTGTALGDPVEIEALTQAFGVGTAGKGSCALGSVKTNIGHLDAAAGVAGLIKAVLVLEKREIPPSLHFEKANPRIDFASTPFRVNARLQPWSADGPRRAGVSSFGIGGTNAHVVLQEAPAAPPAAPVAGWQLLVLSARTEASLARAAEGLRAHLPSTSDAELADVAYTLQAGRRAFRHRRAVLCRGVDEAVRALSDAEPSLSLGGFAPDGSRRLVFLFPGQGAQRVGAGAALHREGGVFREELDRCCDLLKPELGVDLRGLLYPPAGLEAESERQLQETWLTQPAVFALDWALARQWLAWGLSPCAFLGHSVGEYVAACLAGVMAAEDAIRLVAERGRLLQSLPRGAMLAVPLPEAEVLPLVAGALSLAAVNAPSQCVLSGPEAAIAAAASELRGRGIEGRRLRTSHAFHSSMTEPILAAFEARVRSVRLHAPRIPFLSNVTGTWVTAEQATEPAYWSRQIRSTVRFADALDVALADGAAALLEVGPGSTLTGLARQHASFGPQHVALSSMQTETVAAGQAEPAQRVLARLWACGVEVDWKTLHAGSRRRRVPLPTYPFERRRYFVEPPSSEARPRSTLPRKRRDVGQWCSVPVWRQVPPGFATAAEAADSCRRSWLVLAEATGPGAEVAAALRRRGEPVAVAHPGRDFERHSAEEFTIRPEAEEDYRAVLRELAGCGREPRLVVHAWSAGFPDEGAADGELLDRAWREGFGAARLLLQALAQVRGASPLRLVALASGLHEVIGGEATRPERLPLLGVCRVAPQEQPDLECLSLDVTAPGSGALDDATLDLVIEQCLTGEPGSTLAIRNGHLWREDFGPVPLPPALSDRLRIREGGTYLITGGLGRIGLEIAGFLARSARARLVLVGRSRLPERGEWADWVSSRGEADPVSRRIVAVLALESLGAEVVTVQADVADAQAMEARVAGAEARLGPIHGVVHAAGVTTGPSFGPLGTLSAQACAEQFRVKVQGTHVLQQVLAGRALDFCVLMSSLSTALGGLGMAAYAAANLYLDGVAVQRRQAGEAGWTSVGWDGWWLGEEGGARPATPLAALAMSRAEGIAVLERLLGGRPTPRVLISTADLAARGGRWVEREEPPESAAAAATRHPRRELSGAYVAPRNEVERSIAGIWQTLLGIEEVGVHDGFLELGGHSLLATQIATRLRETFGVEVALRDVFEAATVAGLAERVASAGGKSGRAEKVAQVVQRLKSLSPEERRSLLQRERELRERA
ncbi:MAG TPA: SDR family NAD(P)-dependent oxidoreductase [Vicinamibacteria bacterium]|nr:SDR family NAD(P)-dependent oxidoreductase [Vicinamibacteria bacterium]